MSSDSIVQSKVLGPIQKHAETNMGYGYSTKKLYSGTMIEINFECFDSDTFSRLLSFAERFWEERKKNFKTFQEYAVAELLDQLNGSLDCGEEDPPQVTRTELLEILEVPSGLSFLITGSENVLTCRIGGGEDKRLKENYIYVYVCENGELGDAELISLL